MGHMSADESAVVQTVLNCINDTMQSKDAFAAWLADKGSDPVGKARTREDCPIQHFLSEVCGADLSNLGIKIKVDAEHITITRRSSYGWTPSHGYADDSIYLKASNPPPWALSFIARVDNLEGTSVGGDTALSVLEHPEEYTPMTAYLLQFPSYKKAFPEEVAAFNKRFKGPLYE